MRLGLLLSATLVCTISAALLPAAEPAPAKPVILLTGFEPFGGDPVNASWEVVKTFEGKELSGYTIKTALLPVVYDEMAQPLLDAIKASHPVMVISFGVGTPVVQIETVARNGYHPQKPLDNKSKPPPATRSSRRPRRKFPPLCRLMQSSVH